ncbi:hypothetical protein [Legionella sp. CNM-4043-24]|uniref:hypothetical protein n=1 Tax=Legionella sp. CNM-4043-24 TaxID=3421646 RepID=UPI00403B2CC5
MKKVSEAIHVQSVGLSFLRWAGSASVPIYLFENRSFVSLLRELFKTCLILSQVNFKYVSISVFQSGEAL